MNYKIRCNHSFLFKSTKWNEKIILFFLKLRVSSEDKFNFYDKYIDNKGGKLAEDLAQAVYKSLGLAKSDKIKDWLEDNEEIMLKIDLGDNYESENN